MLFKQSFAIAVGLILGTGIIHPPAQAQSVEHSPVIAQVNNTNNNTNEEPSIPIWIWLSGGIFIIILLPRIGWIVGLISVGESQVGIITKKFSTKNLPPGRLTALNGEAGLQADTLSPGFYFGYFPWQYSIKKEPVIVIPQDEIGLIVANDGSQIPADRILGRRIDCDRFQDARKFLLNHGGKGRQIDILTTGNYRINTAIFQVITSVNCQQYGMSPAQLRLKQIDPERVGIATTLDGKPIEDGEIAGEPIPSHDNYQDVQKFIIAGGRRGLQEQVILSGSWNLNPWFVNVEQIAMTTVPIGHVGVVISYVGRSHSDLSGAAFTHGNIVRKGDKGVWVEPIYPGKHPLNKQVMEVQLVPTTNVVLNFTARFTGKHGYDTELQALKLLSHDGFTFELEVFQIIHIGALDAPKVISRLGSMQNLIDQVLRPIVANYFRNASQEYTILDFLTARSERQAEAAEHIRQALKQYDVQAVDTLIGMITPPPELMQTLIDRKIAQEQEKTYEVQRVAQVQRQELVRATALAEIQNQVVTAEEGVNIAKLQAAAKVKEAEGEAEGIRAIGQAKADAYKAGVDALGEQAYASLQVMQIVGERQVRIVPNVSVTNAGASGGNGLVDALLGMWAQNPSTLPIQLPQTEEHVPTNGAIPVATVSSVDDKPQVHNSIKLTIKGKEPTNE
jgi:uncharacterized membrane protein YqiK